MQTGEEKFKTPEDKVRAPAVRSPSSGDEDCSIVAVTRSTEKVKVQSPLARFFFGGEQAAAEKREVVSVVQAALKKNLYPGRPAAALQAGGQKY